MSRGKQMPVREIPLWTNPAGFVIIKLPRTEVSAVENGIPAIKKEKAYLRIVDVIMDLIARGEVSYDDDFYTEQELMNMLGVSRPTLREALRVLEFLGVAAVTPHKGISIRRPSDQGGYLPLLYILTFEKTSGRELFELRQALQLEMTALAAQRRTQEDLEALDRRIAAMEQARDADAEEFSRLDYDFHQQIIAASGNRLVAKLMDTIAPMIRDQLTAHIRNESMDHRNLTLSYHRRIVACIAASDAQAARMAMYDHLADSRRDAQLEAERPVQFGRREKIAIPIPDAEK